MKKILLAMLCLALTATVVLTGCKTKKEDVADDGLKAVVEQEEEVSDLYEYSYEMYGDEYLEGIVIEAYLGDEKEVVVPDSFYDVNNDVYVPVVFIGERAFAENETLEAVVLPDTVLEIRDGAFQNCPNLKAVGVPSGLTLIGKYVFDGSYNFEKLGMTQATLLALEEERLAAEAAAAEAEAEVEETAELEADEVPAGETVEGAVEEAVTEEAPAEEATEEAVTEEAPVEEATEEAEESEESEESATLYDIITNEFPATVESIGLFAFSTANYSTPWYDNLIADTTKSIVLGDGILIKYNGEKTVELGEDIKSVAYYAFKDQTDLHVTFDKGIKTVDNTAFYGSLNTTIVIPMGHESIPGIEALIASAKERGTDMKFTIEQYVVIPEEQLAYELEFTQTDDGGEAKIVKFNGNGETDITVLTIAKHPETGEEYYVTEIGEGAFMDNTDLVSVTIDSSILTIGANAFAGCTSLTDVYVDRTVENFTMDVTSFAGAPWYDSIVVENVAAEKTEFDNFTTLVEIDYDEVVAVQDAVNEAVAAGGDAGTVYMNVLTAKAPLAEKILAANNHKADALAKLETIKAYKETAVKEETKAEIDSTIALCDEAIVATDAIIANIEEAKTAIEAAEQQALEAYMPSTAADEQEQATEEATAE